MVRSKFVTVVAAAFLGASLVGCASYYEVRDPSNGKVYYTKDLDHMSGGSVKLKDDRTGAKVTIQNSEVHKIKKDKYEQGLRQAESPTATPAAKS